MKPGERMVWAAVFAGSRGAGRSVAESVRLAALEVKNLRTLAIHDHLLEEDDDARTMLHEMIDAPRAWAQPGGEITIPATAGNGFAVKATVRGGR